MSEPAIDGPWWDAIKRALRMGRVLTSEEARALISFVESTGRFVASAPPTLLAEAVRRDGGGLIALIGGPLPGMLCGSRLTETGERCTKEAGHGGDHEKLAKPEPGPEYKCPLHWDVIRDEPAACPVCGNALLRYDEKP